MDIIEQTSNDTGVETTSQVAIKHKIEAWGDRLIDLTHRNRLVYFQPDSSSVVEISSPSASELFERLTSSNKPLRFDAISTDISFADGKGSENVSIRKGDVETSIDPQKLLKLLRRLIRNYVSYKQEQGLHTLFLTCGMVHWKENDNSNLEVLSPVILLPVQLELDKTRNQYTLTMADEETVVNPALKSKFESEFNLEVQELKENLDWKSVRDYLLKLRQQISGRGWKVDHSMWLSRFHFEKFAMYKELRQNEKELSQNPILQAIANPDEFKLPISDLVLTDLDKEIDPKRLFTVLDADSSQLEVIERASKGENLVVYGPPGTGKSQTIVNIISQLLMDGKKVLFVSEKMAALEVVYRKLENLGLDFACLELHSHRSNKSKVIEELGRTIRAERPSHGKERDDEKFGELINLRQRLDEYVNTVHNKIAGLGLSPYQVVERLCKLGQTSYKKTGLLPDDVLNLTLEELDKKLMNLRRLSVETLLWKDFKHNPWRESRLDIEKLTLEGRQDFLNKISFLHTRTKNCLYLLIEAKKELGINAISRLPDIKKLMRFLNDLEKAFAFRSHWFNTSTIQMDQLYSEISNAEIKRTQYMKEKEQLETHFERFILQLPIDEIAEHFKNNYQTPLRFLHKQYREDKATLEKVVKNQSSLKYDIITKSLESAINVRNFISYMNKVQEYFTVELGNLYQGVDTDWKYVRDALSWFRNSIWNNEMIANPDALMKFDGAPDELSKLAMNLNSRLTQEYEGTVQSTKEINQYSENGKGVELFRLEHLEDLSKTSALASDESILAKFVDFFRLKIACEKAGLSEFINHAITDLDDPSGIDKTFEFSFYTEWLRAIIDRTPIFKDFNPQFHIQNITKFQTLDRELTKSYARVIEARCRERQPTRHSSFATDSEVSKLLREASKKRRHMPLRKLFEQTRNLIQDLKPCILMSPLSVSTYLPIGMRFDVVIFDEASQVKPEDAIGAIARGKRLIVVGDNKQLPPTTFFESDATDAGLEGDDDNDSLESILDECRASNSFREMYLKWHYRSKHEELIAFSNRYFYDNKLVTFPSPYPAGKSNAVTLIEVKKGTYDRGGTRTNRVEAAKVVDLIVEHVKRWGTSKSLGIVTLSIAQEEAILDEIEQRSKVEYGLNALDNDETVEPFFVKSLEKVQGDERDYIVISIGYGRDSKGSFSMNFGPLNKAGGERRLNVAITRARIKTTVVASITKSDINLDNSASKSEGILVLRNYLDYAKENGVFNEEYSSKGESESPFEEHVKHELQRRGFEVDSQIGASGYRIDLGIRSPISPDQYILGIECDGASYHSSRTARDRDRLRQEVLEQRGWEIYRIWSTDWFKHPVETINALVETIQNHINREYGSGSSESALRGGSTSEPVPSKAEQSYMLHDNDSIQLAERKNKRIDIKDSSAKIHDVAAKDILTNLPRYTYSVHKKFAIKRIGIRDPSELHLAIADNVALGALKSEIMNIVKVEAPITETALTERILLTYGMKRAREGATYAINLAIKDLISAKKISFAKDAIMVYQEQVKEMKPRIPRMKEEPRPIQEMPLIEILAAIRLLCSTEYSMPIESLAEGVSKMLGYKRMGKSIESKIKDAIKIALSERVFEVENGVVHILS